MGKHFVLKFASLPSSTRLYTTVLCMTDDNIQLRKALIDYFDGIMKQNKDSPFVPPQSPNEDKNPLPFIIKKYDFPAAFSRRLHQVDINNIRDNAVYIEGPVGRGLELSENARGTHVIFAAGTGILPFMDLLNYMLMKSIHEVLTKKNNVLAESMNVYEEGYSKTLDSSFNIVLCGSFASEREMVGFDIVSKLAEINADYGLKNFRSVVRGVRNENVQRIGKFDLEFLKENVGKNVEKVMICGPPEFNRELLQWLRETGFESEKIQIV